MGKNSKAAKDNGVDETGYKANVNQARDEPIPASHHEERQQDAVLRNEEYSSGYPAAPGETGSDGEADAEA